MHFPPIWMGHGATWLVKHVVDEIQPSQNVFGFLNAVSIEPKHARRERERRRGGGGGGEGDQEGSSIGLTTPNEFNITWQVR